MTLALTVSLLSGFAGPSSGAADDDHRLRHQKDRLQDHIKARVLDLDEISNRLVRTKQRVDAAVADLDASRTQLADVRERVRRATIRDDEMQMQLDAAILRWQDAGNDLVQGRLDVEEQRSALTEYAVWSYQTGETSSLNLDIAFQAQTPQEALDQMASANAVLDKQSVEVQELEAAQVLLRLTEQRVEDTKDEVAGRRAEAAQTLEDKQTLEEQGEIAAQRVADRVNALRQSKQEIQAAKHRERDRLATLKKERDRVEAKLRKIAERRARQARRDRLAQARANKQALAQARADKQAQHAPRADEPAKVTSSNDGGFLEYPVGNTYVTSSYGMRMHPILHIYKLHDGTDFHAACGSPVYAAASGRIISEYFNAGYGNRIIMDHGLVRGVSLSTSYNHLTSFVAGTGESVRRGQLIGYSGTTGYSTGCHLHFMVYVNGYTANPAGWL